MSFQLIKFIKISFTEPLPDILPFFSLYNQTITVSVINFEKQYHRKPL